MVNIDEGYQQAIEVIRKCAHPFGLFASGTKLGYTAVWARDSMITLIGASLTKEKFIKKAFENSLKTLAKYQSKHGQIPNAVDIYDLKRRKPQINYATIDSSLWYILGHMAYKHNYHSNVLFNKYKNSIEKAFTWLSYQDSSESSLIEQQPNADWEDAFPHKYGHVFHDQVLYYAALKLLNHKKQAEKIKGIVNGTYYTGKFLTQHGHHHPWYNALNLYDKKLGYYLPWSWKDHDGIRETEYWFDSLANILAVVFKVADKNKSNKILNHMHKARINRPYPVKAIYPPIKEHDPEWHPYFKKAITTPYQYLNAGIWPMIGSFYIAALITLKKYSKAEKELQLLAQANHAGLKDKWRFSEWLHGKTGKPDGSMYQAWSAGSYIFAYECVKRRKVPIFNKL